MVSLHVLTIMFSLIGRGVTMQLTQKASTPAPPPCAKPGSSIIPSKGMYRGSTNINATFYADQFGSNLHIMRLFPTQPFQFTEHQLGYAEWGGILFISPQPEEWATFPNSTIQQIAHMVNSAAPATVMVAMGYEPDGHCKETAINDNDIKGNALDWIDLQRRAHDIFQQESVTNAKWVLDFSTDMAMNFEPAAHILWPGDDYVDILLWNVFQNESSTDCRTVAEMVYRQFEDASGPGFNYTGVPWGIGAWGSWYENDHTPYPELIPLEDRKSCLYGMNVLFNAGTHDRLKYSIFYNSDTSIIQEEGSWNPDFNLGYNNTPDLMDAYTNLLNSDVFKENDCYSEPPTSTAI